MVNKYFWMKLLFFLILYPSVYGQSRPVITAENFKPYLDSARLNFKEYRYKQALQTLEQLYAFDSTNVQVTNQLAELYTGLNNQRNSLYFFSKTLSQDSLNLFALISSGDIYLRNGDPGVAQAFYFRVINYVDSNNYYAFRQIANTYYAMGEDLYPFALIYFHKAVRNNPYDVHSFSRMGNIYNVTNQYHLADSVCRAGLLKDSLNSTLLNIKAYALYNMKRYAEAVQNFDLVLQKEDTTAFNLKYTGMSFFNMNDFPKARHYLERAVVYDSTDYDQLIILGRIYLQDGENDKGLECLQRAEKINFPPPQKWSEIYKAMADIYNRQEKWENAMECFKQAYKLNPDDKTLVCKLAYQYDYLNQKDKAIALYNQVLETADPEIYVTEIKLARERFQKLKIQSAGKRK